LCVLHVAVCVVGKFAGLFEDLKGQLGDSQSSS
jgi:hypothetical protein